MLCIGMQAEDACSLAIHSLLHHQGGVLLLLDFQLGFLSSHRLSRLWALLARHTVLGWSVWTRVTWLRSWLRCLRQLLRLWIGRGLGLLWSSLGLLRLICGRLSSLVWLRSPVLLWWAVLRLRGGTLGFMHVRRLR